MKQMICSICSYTYDESVGIPDAGIAPGTKWEDLPADWKCPVCKAGKDAFKHKEEKQRPRRSLKSPMWTRNSLPWK